MSNIRLTTHFVGACWGHAMSKCCQYATDDNKISLRLIASNKEAINFAKNYHLDKEKWEGVT
jgi:hypothetical protein